MSTQLNRVKFLALSGVIALAIMVRIVCFVGLIGSDDLTYNYRAYEVLTGTFAPQPDHQASRIGLILPVAAAFRIFGINEVSSVVFPFVCGLLTFGLVLWVGIAYLGWWIGLMAGCLYAFLPIDMFQASILLPDLPAATCIAISAVLMYRGEPEDARKHARVSMLLAGLFLGGAYLIKETSVFFGVFVVGYAGYRCWRRKKFSWGWAWFATGALILVGMEFGYYAWTAGTPFFRYVAVQTAHNASIFSGRHYQGLDLVRRLSLDTFSVLFHITDFSILYVFVLAGSVYSFWKRNAFILFLVGWAGCLLLLYNFAPTSFSGYYPLLLFHRFFLVLSVPAVLICAWFFREIVQALLANHKQNMKQLRVSLMVPCIPLLAVNIIWFSWLTSAMLCVPGLLIALTYVRSFHQWLQVQGLSYRRSMFVPTILLFITVLPGFVLAVRGERLRKGLTCERELLSVLESPLRHAVYTDRRTELILEFFSRYQYEDLIMVFHDMDLETVGNAYVIANWERLFFLNTMYNNRIPETLFHPPAYWKGPIQLGGSINPCLVYQVPAKP